MLPPIMPPAGLKSISVHLPNRDELLFRTVFALPNASITGLDFKIYAATVIHANAYYSHAYTTHTCRNKQHSWRRELVRRVRLWATCFVPVNGCFHACNACVLECLLLIEL